MGNIIGRFVIFIDLIFIRMILSKMKIARHASGDRECLLAYEMIGTCELNR